MKLDEALGFYAALNLNIIPLRARDKRPIGDWMTYQTRMSTPDERAMWWPKLNRPGASFNNVGVVTGAISNILVLDFDDDDTYAQVLEVMPWLAESMVVHTGRGHHVYLRPTTPAGRTTTFQMNDKRHHVKSDGGYVVAPPSIHPSGSVYTLDAEGVMPIEIDPGIITRNLVKMGAQAAPPEGGGQTAKPRDWVGDLLRNDVPDGKRNDTAAQLAGWFRNVIIYRPDITLDILDLWNQAHCKPPMDYAELETLVNHKYRQYPPPPGSAGALA